MTDQTTITTLDLEDDGEQTEDQAQHPLRMVNNEIARLDEAVIVQEMILQNLYKRKELLARQREGMESKLQQYQLELVELESSQANLEKSMTQHLALQQELEAQLAKTEEKMIAFTGNTDELVIPSESSARSEEDTGHPDGLEEDQRDYSSEVDDDVKLQTRFPDDEEEDSKPDTRSDSKKHGQLTNKGYSPATIEDPFVNTSSNKGLSNVLLKARPGSSFLTFHLQLHGPRLIRLWEFMENDHLALDAQYGNGQHRRQALFHSCLLPFEVSWDEKMEDATKKTDGLGLRPAAMNDVQERLDPDMPLCPYELQGECADPYCIYQHLKERKVETLELIKELLPLPEISKLNLFPLENSPVSPTKDSQNLEPAPKKIKISERDSSVSEKESSGELDKAVDGESKSKSEILDMEQDFLSIPVDHDDGTAGVGPQEEGKPETPRMWWMTIDDEARVDKFWREQQQNPTLQDWLKAFFGIKLYSNTLYVQLYLKDSNFQSLLQTLGKLVDALKMIVHAGRYDIANALLANISRLLSKLDPLFQTKHLQSFFSQFPAFWKLNYHQKIVCAEALRTQLILSCVSELLRMLHIHRDAVSGKLWQDVIERITCATDQGSADAIAVLLDKIKTKLCSSPDTRIVGDGITCLLSLCGRIQQWYNTNDPTGFIAGHTDFVEALDDIVRKSEEGASPIDALAMVAQAGLIATNAVILLASSTQKFASKLEARLDSLCLWMIETCDYQLHTLITPVAALRVCILVSLKRYDKAHHALESFLGEERSLQSMSDLLWSQFVMLRVSLPSCEPEPEGHEQRKPVSHQVAHLLEKYGVKLNYLTILGDRNLWKPCLANICSPSPAKKEENCKKWRNQLKVSVNVFIHKVTTTTTGEGSVSLMDLSLRGMSIDRIEYPGNRITLDRVVFPRTLLLGGYLLRKLDLSDCKIKALPPQFGNFFFNLKELSLRNNKLKTLPPSIGSVSILVQLDAQDNRLAFIPEELGECSQLEKLLLSNNQLKSLPDSIRNCSQLREVLLARNWFETYPDLVQHIETLVTLDLFGNPCE